MVRNGLAVLLGFAPVAVFIMFSLWVTRLIFGSGGGYRLDTSEPSQGWLFLMIACLLVVSLVAGIVCASIAVDRRPSIVLATIVLFLGLLAAAPQILIEEPTPRPGPETVEQELAEDPEQSTWFALATPFVGAGGVLLAIAFAGPGNRRPGVNSEGSSAGAATVG